MPTSKRLRAPLIVMSGVILGMVALAGPANAATSVYPPPPGTQVLGASASTQVLGATASTGAVTAQGAAIAPTSATGLAFTGANAIGIGALGGLLLVGGGALVLVGKRRKVDA
jgi:hypothetical protein